MAKKRRSSAKQLRPANIPAARTKVFTSGKPTVNGSNRVIVRHQEYVGTFKAYDPFTCYSYAVNPGNQALFPWLSHIAHNYEEYKFHSLKFEYLPSVSSASQGTVMLSIDYDCLDSIPISKQGLLQNERAVRGSTWTPLTMVCDQKTLSSRPALKVRSGNSAVGDLRLSNLGNFLCASNSCDNPLPGDIVVSYEIEFFIPQYNISDEAFDDSAKVTSVGPSSANPIPLASTIEGGLPIKVSEDNTIQMEEAGEYLMVFDWVGTGIANVITATSLAGEGVVATLINYTINAAATSATCKYKVRNVNAGARMLIAAGALTTLTVLKTTFARYAYSLT